MIAAALNERARLIQGAVGRPRPAGPSRAPPLDDQPRTTPADPGRRELWTDGLRGLALYRHLRNTPTTAPSASPHPASPVVEPQPWPSSRAQPYPDSHAPPGLPAPPPWSPTHEVRLDCRRGTWPVAISGCSEEWADAGQLSASPIEGRS